MILELNNGNVVLIVVQGEGSLRTPGAAVGVDVVDVAGTVDVPVEDPTGVAYG
jgi:hypothetical protein